MKSKVFSAAVAVFLLAPYAIAQMSVVTCGNSSGHDDSNAIFNAVVQPLTQSPAIGKVVLLPANQACYANLLGYHALPPGAKLMGVPGQSVLKPFSPGQPIIAIQGANASSPISNISVEGVTFDAMGANMSWSGNALVTVKYAQNFRFVNNVIRSSAGNVVTGEALNIGDSSAVIEDNDISNFGTQIDLWVDGSANLPPGAAVTVAHNRMYNNSSGGGDGIFVHGYVPSPIQDFPVLIEGNTIINTVASAGNTGQTGNAVGLFQVAKIRVVHNYASHPQFSCFRSAWANDIIFSGNQCLDAGDTAMYSEFASQHNQWISNEVEGARYACLALTNYGYTSTPGEYHSAIGNHLKNCGNWGVEVEGYSIVEGNMIDHAPTGIQMGYGNGKDVIVKNNLIFDSNPGGSGAMQLGIGIEQYLGGGNIIDGNQIDLTVPAVAGTANGFITNNGVLPAGVLVRNQQVPQDILGHADAGSMVYCPNCAMGNCYSTGSGSFARKIGSNWNCQ